MSRTIGSLLYVLPLLLSACGPNISSVRTGALFMGKDSGCSIEFVNGDYQQVTSSYQNIGLITVTQADQLTPKVREAVRQKACAMGADAVSLNASVDFGSSLLKGMTQFLVLRRPQTPVQAAKAPVPPQT